MDNWNLLVGGPFIAAFIACWGYIQSVLSKIRSIFIINVKIRGSELKNALIFYLSKNAKRLKVGDYSFLCSMVYIKKTQQFENIIYEGLNNSGNIFILKKFIPIILFKEDKNNQQTSSNYNSYPIEVEEISFSVIRGSINTDKLLIDALNFYRDRRRMGFLKGQRFLIEKAYGSVGTKTPKLAIVSEQYVSTYFSHLRLLNWEEKDISFSPIFDTDAELFGDDYFSYAKAYLSFPDNVWEEVHDAKKWLDSKQWYRKKYIPWKIGWLLYGKPGCGKTSMVRALGKILDLPITSFVLSTFTDKDFQDRWESLMSMSPCIALIEDFDSTFKGRENISIPTMSEKPLSFDTVLNAIDGVMNSDGIFTIITTNNVDSLDEALGKPSKDGFISTRPGRIDKVICLDIMEEKGRYEMAERILSDCPKFIEETVKIGEGETPAQFQNRCTKIALKEFWKNK